MPTVSPAQERLMQAAAHTPGGFAGVPQSVGKEFVADAKGHAAGTLFVAPDGDVLLLHRARDGGNYQGYWALPGGGANDGEDPAAAAAREAFEEMGVVTPKGRAKVLDRRRTPTDMVFHTFIQPVPEKFAPRLNGEHTGYAWAPLHMLPQPTHPSLRTTLDERLGLSADMTPEDWDGLRSGLLKWLAEEADEPEHAEDIAFDRMPLTMAGAPARAGLAFDKESVRTKSVDGRLHVAVTNISKAAVNPYLGREIPDWQALGLEPERVYQLLRDPDELARAAPSFNHIPVLSEHVAVTVDEHHPDLVVGATGTDAEFVTPYLRNSLVIWTRGGIESVESEEKKELSSAYRYRADMTPGVFEGQKYDGVMRDIVANHVALVREGRAGSDVVVGDSKEVLLMSKSTKPQVLSRRATVVLGALLPYLAPKLKLAQDAKINFHPILADVTDKNYQEKKPAIAAALKEATKGLMAKDADLSDVVELLDKLDKVDAPDIIEAATDPNGGTPPDNEAMDDDDPMAKIKAFLAGKISDEDMAQLLALMAAPVAAQAQDDPPPFKGMPKVGGAKDAEPDKDKDKDDKDKKDMAKDMMVTRPAMDAAIRAATAAAIKTQRDIRDAERAVRPYVGELAMSFDSADEVYKNALTSLGVKVDGVHPSAFPTILAMQPKPGEQKRTERVAMDSAGAKGFQGRFPTAARVTIAS